jgi:hypothetical protein
VLLGDTAAADSCDCGTFAGTGTCPHAAALRELRDRGEL